MVITGVADAQVPPSLDVQDLLAALRPLRCSNALVQGSYGFLAEGFAGPPTIPANLAGPLSGVGTVVFDAGGSFLLTATRSVNGVQFSIHNHWR